ncbi:hypothetical protein EO98_14990 [Methanosarcina sp. 2.H.T.1A.6]|nr:hypothetical protein EO94_00660 [Methanosarcina sp. 2.H.T.1A.3]KKG22817.1 hypothetical protein EO98_14990 [Methanosarcina sp. 2.H.T.1A.6]KKG24453.1 hypothetical protein EO96_14875 [Methanosarcina sp. 2.H.T.1A.8]KKG25947.1 hypothetical protein EO97_12690 [Methanosarcina sp. 2.H.T.1A.15]
MDITSTSWMKISSYSLKTPPGFSKQPEEDKTREMLIKNPIKNNRGDFLDFIGALNPMETKPIL